MSNERESHSHGLHSTIGTLIGYVRNFYLITIKELKVGIGYLIQP